MDTKELKEAIALLAELDPAEVPEHADRITETLADLLEDPEDTSAFAASLAKRAIACGPVKEVPHAMFSP